jgi:hypothetical protein
MTKRPHLSATQGGGGGVAALVVLGHLGRKEQAGLRGGFGPEAGKEKGERKPFCYFQESSQNLNSNTNLNSNKQKQCNNMCATVNSYSSLI